MNGRKLHELRFSRAARQHEQVIDMGSLTPGVYLLRALVGGRVIIRKIVKR
ncbi:T9SS type A sorting domain-containing protein [Spirosoma areae]